MFSHFVTFFPCFDIAVNLCESCAILIYGIEQFSDTCKFDGLDGLNVTISDKLAISFYDKRRLPQFRNLGWTICHPSAYVFASLTVLKDFGDIIKNFFGGHQSFLWLLWYPCFELLVTSAPGFRVRVDPSLVCFLACMQQIPPICFW